MGPATSAMSVSISFVVTDVSPFARYLAHFLLRREHMCRLFKIIPTLPAVSGRDRRGRHRGMAAALQSSDPGLETKAGPSAL
jgi:hypothetical protein